MGDWNGGKPRAGQSIYYIIPATVWTLNCDESKLFIGREKSLIWSKWWSIDSRKYQETNLPLLPVYTWFNTTKAAEVFSSSRTWNSKFNMESFRQKLWIIQMPSNLHQKGGFEWQPGEHRG